jgi:hypothetical protein
VIVMRVRYALPALAPAVLAVGLAVGCSKPTAGTAPTSSTPTSTAATSPAPAPAEAKVELAAVSAAGFEEAIRGLRGKVVLVDAWFLG